MHLPGERKHGGRIMHLLARRTGLHDAALELHGPGGRLPGEPASRELVLQRGQGRSGLRLWLLHGWGAGDLPELEVAERRRDLPGLVPLDRNPSAFGPDFVG